MKNHRVAIAVFALIGALIGALAGFLLVPHASRYTASANVARELHAVAAQASLGFVDAPVSGGQAGVNRSPALHDHRGTPPVHDQVVELDRQAVQFVGGAQQNESPGRGSVERERLCDAQIPVRTHRSSRIFATGHVNDL